MKTTGYPNINTRSYWNGIYSTLLKRDEYKNTQTNTSTTITNRFRFTLKEVKDGDKFLDIGCGVGALTNLVNVSFPNCEVWGTDISSQAIADNEREQPGVKFLARSVGNLYGIPDNYFDVVFAGEILEHLDDPNTLFKDAKEKLKTGGKFVVTTPNESMIQSTEHTWLFDKDDVIKLYQDNGFGEPTFINLPDMEHILVIMAVGIKL